MCKLFDHLRNNVAVLMHFTQQNTHFFKLEYYDEDVIPEGKCSTDHQR